MGWKLEQSILSLKSSHAGYENSYWPTCWIIAGTSSHITMLEEAGLGIRLLLQRDTYTAAPQRELRSNEKSASTIHTLTQIYIQCWTWRAGNGLHWQSTARIRNHLGVVTGYHHPTTEIRKGLADPGWVETVSRLCCGWRPQVGTRWSGLLRTITVPLVTIRHFHPLFLRLWKTLRTQTWLTGHGKLCRSNWVQDG